MQFVHNLALDLSKNHNKILDKITTISPGRENIYRAV